MSWDAIKRQLMVARAWATRFRVPILLLALAFLVVGTVWSVRSLSLDPAQLQAAPFAALVFVLVPVSIVTGAWNLRLLGEFVEADIAWRDSAAATAYGRVSEILPVPGSAMVRGAMLLRAGASMKTSAGALVWSSLLTVAMAGLLGAFALLGHTPITAIALGTVSAAALITITIWMVKRAAPVLVAKTLLVRVLNIGISVLRFAACFAALGFAVDLLTSSAFVMATSITNYATIVPAGLGVGEASSAAVALLVGIAPSAAFLAAALNRIVGLAVNGLFALGLSYWPNGKLKPET